MFVLVAVLAARTGRIRRQTARAALAVLGGVPVVAVALALTHSTDAGAGVASHPGCGYTYFISRPWTASA